MYHPLVAFIPAAEQVPLFLQQVYCGGQGARCDPQGGGNGGPRPNQPRQKREEKPRVWQPKPQAPQGEMSFEDMMARYKSRSEEKIADLKRVTENHRGGYSRRRG